jgi:hypothetical protein
MTPLMYNTSRTWALPPVILHPFSETNTSEKLLQSSRAGLILQGVLPAKDESLEHLDEVLLEGRHSEIRMLYYVGKDTSRWIDQCLDLIQREQSLRSAGIEWQSFAALLIENPPQKVQEKLKSWGVTDHKVIFSRSLGLNSVFGVAPSREMLSHEFIRDYHRYADKLYDCRMNASRFTRLQPSNFPFELYASGEYASMLEREWQTDESHR